MEDELSPSIPNPWASTGRLKHKKVRTGCKKCKQRKIKCDEQKPACRNCVRYLVACDYGNGSSETTATLGSSLDSALYAVLESPTIMSVNNIHLQLLHNYSTLTCHTLSSYPPLRTMWRINVPQLGFSTEYVMRGILAISALHMSRLYPAKADAYLSVAQCEHETALRTATEQLRNVTAANCSALFIFSVMTFFCTLASPRKSGYMLLLDGNGIPDWLAALRGLRHISDTAAEELLAGPFAAAVAFAHTRFDQGRLGSSLTTSAAWLSTVEHKQLATVRQLVWSTVTESQTASIYSDSIDTLEACFFMHHGHLPVMDVPSINVTDPSIVPNVAETTTILTWPYLASSEYIELLSERQQIAMVIFAHYCVLLQSLDSCWWMRGWPSHLIQNTWTALNEQHRLWIRWPIEEIGWQPDA